MSFEFDPAKSLANEAKHGINFVAAQHMWEDENRLEIRARTVGEARWMIVARIDEQVWAAIVTYRDDKVRLISVRKARKDEVRLYEG